MTRTIETEREQLFISGGIALEGTVAAAGAKNSALKLLPATLLAAGHFSIENVPDVADIGTMLGVLETMGVQTARPAKGAVEVDVPKSLEPVASYELTSKMRASIQVLGPLLARCGHAQVAMPGGCNLGSRKLDLHLRALEDMGATFSTSHGDLVAKADRLVGRRIVLEFPSMGATENVILAAVGADGETELENAAREPEIADLCSLLSAMGAKIEGAGTTTIRIEGGTALSPPPAPHPVIPDRIEVGTYLIAGAITGGDVTVSGARPDHLELFLNKLQQMGVDIETSGEWPGAASVRVRRSHTGLRSADVVTLPYPGFPTDLQPQSVALLSLAGGTSVVTENVFDGRYQYIFELNRMGANIRTEGRHAVVAGVERFEGAPVVAHDIRGGAAVVCAGLAAQGESRIAGLDLIDRGYERIVEKLRGLGAKIDRR